MTFETGMIIILIIGFFMCFIRRGTNGNLLTCNRLK